MYHHDIAREDRIGHDGQLWQQRNQIGGPDGVFAALGIGVEPHAHVPLERLGVKDRVDDEDQLPVSIGLCLFCPFCHAPLHVYMFSAFPIRPK